MAKMKLPLSIVLRLSTNNRKKASIPRRLEVSQSAKSVEYWQLISLWLASQKANRTKGFSNSLKDRSVSNKYAKSAN